MLGERAPESDVYLPLPEAGEQWDPHTIHSHYFGFAIPDKAIGAFIYMRYQPAFPLLSGGVLIYQGLDNLVLSDSLFHDYELTMPWPPGDAHTFKTANGLSVQFVEPGRLAQLSFRSEEGATEFEITATAVSGLAARGHVLPGEAENKVPTSGGSEQFMHYEGTLVVNGERLEVDSYYPRDRSWRQVRRDTRDFPPGPPTTWTPVYFDEGLAFNQIGIDDPAKDPPWAGGFDVDPAAPTHVFGWVSRDGEVKAVTEVSRVATRLHPLTYAPLDMTIHAVDADDERYDLVGTAVAFSPIPAWPNLTAWETLMRWEASDGRVGFGPAQSVWNQRAQHALKRGVGRAAILRSHG
jgi:hypothetical protein